MNDIKVSVIIPVYNCESYLRQCLDSVISQNLPNIEIIIINDSSNDGSQLIINEYSQSDTRVRAIELKENRGVSAARNTGIDKATGKYIIFLDADDYWVDSNMLNHLYDTAQKDNADITRFGFYGINTTGQRVVLKKYDRTTIDLENSNAWSIYYIIWNLFISRELIYKNNIRFDPGIVMGEDALFSCKLYSYASTLSDTNKIFHCYRSNPIGATMGSWNKNKLFSSILWFESAIEVIKSSPAFNHHPVLLLRIASERLAQLTNKLAFVALNILEEEELCAYFAIWSRCFERLNQIFFDRRLSFSFDGLPRIQQEMLETLASKDLNKFKTLSAGSTAAGNAPGTEPPL